MSVSTCVYLNLHVCAIVGLHLSVCLYVCLSTSYACVVSAFQHFTCLQLYILIVFTKKAPRSLLYQLICHLSLPSAVWSSRCRSFSSSVRSLCSSVHQSIRPSVRPPVKSFLKLLKSPLSKEPNLDVLASVGALLDFSFIYDANHNFNIDLLILFSGS